MRSSAVELLVSFSYGSISAGFKISIDKFDGYNVQIPMNLGFCAGRTKVHFVICLKHVHPMLIVKRDENVGQHK